MDYERIRIQLVAILEALRVIRRRMNRDKLYDTAYSLLGTDASPSDLAPDAFGCAETVSDIVRAALPDLKFPLLVSTRDMYLYLLRSPSFDQVDTPDFGDIIISPTGFGNGNLENGHTGIVGKNLSPDGSPYIISNDSRTGTLEVNFTLNSWRRFYNAHGGFPVVFFRVK